MHATETETGGPRVDPRMKHLDRRLLEAFDELWDSFVDPAEAVCDVDGTVWGRLGGGPGGGAVGMPFADEQQLAAIRQQCRALAVSQRVRHQRPRLSVVISCKLLAKRI